MSTKSIGFVGGGRAARLLIGGWAARKTLPAEIVVSDSDQQALNRLKELYPQIEAVADGNARAAGQDVVFLALHPPAIAGAAADVKDAIRPDAIVISLAPKITIARLSELLGGFARIARLIPNAPTVVAAGFNPIAFGAQLSAADRAAVASLLVGLGKSPVVAEQTLEAYAIITAMSPTYFWPQLFELQSLAERFGLSPQQASEGIRETMRGLLQTMYDSGLDRDAVEDLIPIKPLAEVESTICQAYRTKLTALMEKIRP